MVHFRVSVTPSDSGRTAKPLTLRLGAAIRERKGSVLSGDILPAFFGEMIHGTIETIWPPWWTP